MSSVKSIREILLGGREIRVAQEVKTTGPRSMMTVEQRNQRRKDNKRMKKIHSKVRRRKAHGRP